MRIRRLISVTIALALLLAAPAALAQAEREGPLPLSGLIIGIDPGHQEKADRDQEPVAPGSGRTKNRVSSGTYGRWSGVREHEVNLAVGLMLRHLLEGAGATVIMTRETADVSISNVERAVIFNEAKVDLGIRLHCNGSDDKHQRGAYMLVPKDNHPCFAESERAAGIILKAYGKITLLPVDRGISYRGDQTGFNWCERTVVNIEMGHMTNENDDRLLTSPSFQRQMARGLYMGILDCFDVKPSFSAVVGQARVHAPQRMHSDELGVQ